YENRDLVGEERLQLLRGERIVDPFVGRWRRLRWIEQRESAGALASDRCKQCEIIVVGNVKAIADGLAQGSFREQVRKERRRDELILAQRQVDRDREALTNPRSIVCEKRLFVFDAKPTDESRSKPNVERVHGLLVRPLTIRSKPKRSSTRSTSPNRTVGLP